LRILKAKHKERRAKREKEKCNIVELVGDEGGKGFVGRNALDATCVSICRSTSKLQAVRETAIRLETPEMG
jgi:hypothetical protein